MTLLLVIPISIPTNASVHVFEKIKIKNPECISRFLTYRTVAQEEEPKVEHINLKVQDGGGTELSFKVKRNTVFNKIFEAYHKKTGTAVGTRKFFIDGRRLEKLGTPGEMDMEDGIKMVIICR
jgi:hypothetical protein